MPELPNLLKRLAAREPQRCTLEFDDHTGEKRWKMLYQGRFHPVANEECTDIHPAIIFYSVLEGADLLGLDWDYCFDLDEGLFSWAVGTSEEFRVMGQVYLPPLARGPLDELMCWLECYILALEQGVQP